MKILLEKNLIIFNFIVITNVNKINDSLCFNVTYKHEKKYARERKCCVVSCKIVHLVRLPILV